MSYRQKWEEKWIPDMLAPWTAVGSSLLCYNNIFKINGTLYMFGGIYGGASSTRIFSTAWNNPTGWADTGVTAAGLNFGRTGLINNTIVHYGGASPNNQIWTAPISTPLVWSNSGNTVSNPRDNSGFSITPTHVMFPAGYYGSAAGSTNYATVANPTTVATSSSSPLAGWERNSFYIDNDIVYLGGGFGGTNKLAMINARDPNNMSPVDITINYSQGTLPAFFHVGDYIWALGNDDTNMHFVKTTAIGSDTWNIVTSFFSSSVRYISGAQWIGPDGYAFIINYQSGSPYQILRSGRKKIYVLDPPLPGNVYGHRRAVDATTGELTTYTIHCQMGMAPWFTNRRDVF